MYTDLFVCDVITVRGQYFTVMYIYFSFWENVFCIILILYTYCIF
jgi:hypothetical protein